MKKTLAILAALCLLATQFLVCCAENVPEIQPFYSDARRVYANLTINANGVATCSGKIIPKADKTKTSITVKLQQYAGGWKTIETWTGSGTGLDGAFASGKKTVPSGYKYRVSVSGKIKDLDGNVLEQPTKISAERSY